MEERHDYDEGIVMVMADPEGNEFCLVQYVNTSAWLIRWIRPEHLPASDHRPPSRIEGKS
jgi:hypothetical protein